MTDWNAVSAFMANVVVWPGSPTDPGYVNLHYSMLDKKNPAGKKIVTGWPTRTVDDLVQKSAWALTTDYIKDLWFCTSLQSQAGKNSRGNPKAMRGATFALKQKSIWIDVDVEPNNPKKYGTVEEALAAILLFAKTVGLPQPSALVFSGSGVHVYWISKTALTPEEWAPYASGLKQLLLANAIKCDAGLTTDIARILRVPGTLNFKTDPPKPVQLSPTPLVLYNFDKHLGFLTQFAAPVAAAPKPQSVFADGITPEQRASFGLPPVIKVDGPDLNAGIMHEEVLLKAAPIFKQCGFMKHALKTEGADYANPLWNLSVLCSTFMENGNAIAHAISKGHASYTEADTQALFDRKVAERHDRGLGYPSCATIQSNGCGACATCPLFSKGKSPLNIRPPVTATVTPPQAMGQTPGARSLSLPPTFDVNPDGIICKVVERTSREGETSITLVPLFQCVLSNFWVQKFPDCLNYTVTVDKGFTHAASVSHSEMSKQGFRAYLAGPEVRTLVNVAGAAYLEEFYLSILGKLRAEKEAQEAVPFGWYEERGKVRGFVYGGQVMLDDGTTRPCGIGDPVIKRAFSPVGDIQPWFDAAATVTGRKRPELTSIMLMGFAAPLLKLAAKASVMYSVWGTTGAGKSAAYKVGMAIWGHTMLSKGSAQSTRNSVTTQMKETKHLPFYWDEITDDKHRELVAQVMHEGSDGVEKGRNVSGQRAQERGFWKLPIMAAGNVSYREYITDRNPNHAASIVRVLEWMVEKIDGGPGYMNDVDATLLIDALESNYGQMGLLYSRFLAIHHIRIAADVRNMCNTIQRDFKLGGNAERYYIAGVAIMILAARYAKELGVDVDEAEIKKFMYGVMTENLAYLGQTGFAGGIMDNIEVILALYFKKRHAEERMIWTNYIHMSQGKPPKAVSILKGPTQARNAAGGVEVRWAVENQACIIAKTDFDNWLIEKKYSRGQTFIGLKKDFGAIFLQRVQVASGTIHAAGTREPGIRLSVPPNSPLWDYLTLWTEAADKAAFEKAEQPDKVYTGIVPGEEIKPLDPEMYGSAFTPEGMTPTADVVAFVKGAVRG